MIRWLKKQQGFTLVEVLVAISILLLVVSTGYSVFRIAIKSSTDVSNQIEVQQNVRIAAGYIERKLRSREPDEEVEITEIDDGPDQLIIGRELIKLVNTTLYVNHDYASLGSPFNPLAENISDFEVRRDGDRVRVEITGSGEADYRFSITLEVTVFEND